MRFVVWVLVAWIAEPALVRADGGRVVDSLQSRGFRLTLLMSPSTPVVGAVEFSMFTQLVDTGQMVTDLPAVIELTPADGSKTLKVSACPPGDMMFQTASFEVDRPGKWNVVAIIEAPGGPLRLESVVEIGPAPSGWQRWAPWFTWPLAVVLVYLLRQAVVSRRL